MKLSLVLPGFVGLASIVPDGLIANQLSTFTFASILGYNTVWGVIPSLHSPLMSVTNSISGLTAVGGLLLLNPAQICNIFEHGISSNHLALTAILLSAINVGGGFTITKRMLDMFKSKNQATEGGAIYLLPVASSLAAYSVASMLCASSELEFASNLIAGLCCVAGIAGLRSHSTSRQGFFYGLTGVSLGLASTIGSRMPSAGAEFILTSTGTLAAGGLLGTLVVRRMPLTDLPQLVAGFHSLVGLSASLTCIAEYMQSNPDLSGSFHLGSAFLGNWIGAITFTASTFAFAKLHGIIGSKPLTFPGRNPLNACLVLTSIAMLMPYLSTSSPGQGTALLCASGALSALLGVTTTCGIGGWALCAEGFLMNNNLMTIVGALIGCSGAVLSHIMCKSSLQMVLNASVWAISPVIVPWIGVVLWDGGSKRTLR